MSVRKPKQELPKKVEPKPEPNKVKEAIVVELHPEAPWTKSVVTVKTIDGTKFKPAAKVWGRLAIHGSLAPDDPGKYTITHIPSQTIMLTLNSEEDATKVAEILADKCMMELRATEHQELVDKMRVIWWVEGWVRGMNKTGIFVDPFA